MKNILSLPMALVVFAIAGCGGKSEGTVAGNVTLGGQPLTQQGVITFVGMDEGGSSFNAGIVDGKYSSPPMPTGTYRISIAVSGRPAAASVATAPSAEPAPKVPYMDPKYASETTSGLEFIVQPGKNEWNFNLDVYGQP